MTQREFAHFSRKVKAKLCQLLPGRALIGFRLSASPPRCECYLSAAVSRRFRRPSSQNTGARRVAKGRWEKSTAEPRMGDSKQACLAFSRCAASIPRAAKIRPTKYRRISDAVVADATSITTPFLAALPSVYTFTLSSAQIVDRGLISRRGAPPSL